MDKEQSNENIKVYKTDVSFYEDVKYLEKLAHLMGFKHKDIVLFDSLTYIETEQALVYGLCFKKYVYDYSSLFNKKYEAQNILS